LVELLALIKVALFAILFKPFSAFNEKAGVLNEMQNRCFKSSLNVTRLFFKMLN